MAVRNHEKIPAEVESMIELAQLLERMEHNPVSVNADQYRSIVARLSDALRTTPEGDVLTNILATFPASAELYENLNYERSGLSRSDLETSVQAELAATQALKRLSRPH